MATSNPLYLCHMEELSQAINYHNVVNCYLTDFIPEIEKSSNWTF